MTDRWLLDTVCKASSRLYPRERAAFLDMQKRMAAGRLHALSYAQRAWLQEAAARLGLAVSDPGDWRKEARAIKGGTPSAWEPGSAKSFARRSRIR